MNILVIVFAAIAALSKIVDVISTIKFVGAQAETNPIGRILFRYVGCTAGSWIVFAFVAAVLGVFAYTAVMTDSLFEKIGFMVVCAVLTYAHISAGVYNSTGRKTLIVKLALWLHAKMR